jgi:DNA-binding LacI/PurR family transcriptional regulator
MGSTKPSLRLLADACRVSTSTVSRALSGSPLVRPEVRAKIEAAAAKYGYQRNELVGKLMSHLRTGRTERFLGNLAVIHVPSAAQPKLLPAQRRCIAGAVTRAKELGFKLYEFSFGGDGLDAAGYGRMLRARGVQGVIFLFAEPTGLLVGFPTEAFATVEIDYGQPDPSLHTVCLDHFGTLTGALERLEGMGYRRVGLFLTRFKDQRIRHKWSAAFASYQGYSGRIGKVPMLIEDEIDEAVFGRWHQKYRPDAVVGHMDEALGWLQKAGVLVPEDTAFFNLSWTERKRACAGLDLRLELQGEVAAETIIAQIQRGERGQPVDPRKIMVRGRWVDGPTIRAETAGQT